MREYCSVFETRFREDVFLTDDSPNCVGGWFPDVVKTHSQFEVWFKKHSKKCEICSNKVPLRLVEKKNDVSNTNTSE